MEILTFTDGIDRLVVSDFSRKRGDKTEAASTVAGREGQLANLDNNNRVDLKREKRQLSEMTCIDVCM